MNKKMDYNSTENQEIKRETSLYWSPRNAYYTFIGNNIKLLKLNSEIKLFMDQNNLTYNDVITMQQDK